MQTPPAPLGSKIDQSHWPFPRLGKIEGAGVTLEPLCQTHVSDLWANASQHRASFDYLRYGPFEAKADLSALIADLSTREDQPFWAIIPKGGIASGWLSICDIYQSDGNIEIGSIWFSPSLQGTRHAREAIFLLMCHCMDDLGYERLVWRCQAQNEKSVQAAKNLGFNFEGTWRNAAVIDGWQRDIAWFSILKAEWPICRAAFVKWLSADNFDRTGKQRITLQKLRETTPR